MSFSIRDSNIKVYQDSMNFINENLMPEVQHSIAGQKVILEGERVPNAEIRTTPCKIHVTRSSSFDAAREYSGKIAVLNFASSTTPGGGVVKGSSAQEECLCRCSTLYPCLNVKDNWNKFYGPHRAKGTPLHDDDIIYTPDVVIFKDDQYNMLDVFDFTKVDVITCAAPSLRENPNNAYNVERISEQVKISDEDLMKLHEKRARRILDVAAANKVDNLILGAFGCGAFRNKPEVVAQAYKNVLPDYSHMFKEIEFAVYCRPGDDINYQVFNNILG